MSEASGTYLSLCYMGIGTVGPAGVGSVGSHPIRGFSRYAPAPSVNSPSLRSEQYAALRLFIV